MKNGTSTNHTVGGVVNAVGLSPTLFKEAQVRTLYGV